MDGWSICDEVTCQNLTTQLSVYGKRCLSEGCKGSMGLVMKDVDLEIQLRYLENLLDLTTYQNKMEGKSGKGKNWFDFNSKMNEFEVLLFLRT